MKSTKTWQERLKDLEVNDKSGASGSRCMGFSLKEDGRPLGEQERCKRTRTRTMQKSALFGPAHVPRKVLEVRGRKERTTPRQSHGYEQEPPLYF